MSRLIEIDTSLMDIEQNSNDIYETRHKYASVNMKKVKSDVTICIQAYNNIEKTKQCIESVIKYTSNVDYDLLLIDNGSTDGTFEYFKSLNYEKITILRLTKNRGSALPLQFVNIGMFSEYVSFLSGDIVVTSNWLDNMITIAKSDPRIGMVNPVSSNVSNHQMIDLSFSNPDEMQEKAAVFNISNPQKWHEKLRIVTLAALYKKECLFALGIPLSDIGFAHDFGDDDISFRVRRAGYKCVLAKDTWVHHNHDVFNMEGKDIVEYRESLETGRNNFSEKYFGVDAWNDTNFFIPEYLSVLNLTENCDEKTVLGIDTRCGTPILEIKNHLRNYDIFNTNCFAYTTDAKYFIDLQTICGISNVYFGEINGFQDYFNSSFDYIVIGNDINTYSEPFRIIDSAVKLLKKDGQLFVSLKNTYDIFAFLNMTGRTDIYNSCHAINYTAEEFFGKLLQKKYKVSFISARNFESIDKSVVTNAKNCMHNLSVENVNEAVFRLMSERYYFVISI